MTQHSWPVLPLPFTWQPRPAEPERERRRLMEDLELSQAGVRRGADLGIPRGARRRDVAKGKSTASVLLKCFPQ